MTQVGTSLTLIAALLVPFARPAAAQLPAQRGAATSRVIVDIQGLRDQHGRVQIALFRSAAGFPNAPQRAFARRIVPIAHPQVMRVVFDGVPAGEVAVLVHHDEDANGKMAKKLFGQPAEGYGVSRDAKASFGPPKFSDARLLVHPGEQLTLPVHMRY